MKQNQGFEIIPKSIKNRVGRFAIFINEGNNFDDLKKRAELQELMKTIIVIGAIHLKGVDQIQYLAISEQFKEIREGDNIPNYRPEFIVNIETNEIIKTEWRMLK